MSTIVRDEERMEILAQEPANECCAMMNQHMNVVIRKIGNAFFIQAHLILFEITYCPWCQATLSRPDPVEIQFQQERD